MFVCTYTAQNNKTIKCPSKLKLNTAAVQDKCNGVTVLALMTMTNDDDNDPQIHSESINQSIPLSVSQLLGL